VNKKVGEKMSKDHVEHSITRKTKVRITPGSFSDIIFGLALSIGSLILVQRQVQNASSFVANIALFGFSFTIISMVWLSFSTTIRYLPTEAPSVLFLNLLLFFGVVLEPYVFYMLVTSEGQLLGVVSDVFALNIALMFFVLGALSALVAREARLNHPNCHSNDLQVLRKMTYPRYILAALFLLSIIPVFWLSTPLGNLRILLWGLSLAVFLIYHLAVGVVQPTKKPNKVVNELKEPVQRVFDSIEGRWVSIENSAGVDFANNKNTKYQMNLGGENK